MYAYRRLSMQSISESSLTSDDDLFSSSSLASDSRRVSVAPSQAAAPEYPFKYDYDDDDFASERDEPTLPPLKPLVGAKIEEVLDGFFEDALFRCFFPQTLPQSPLSVFFYGKFRQRQLRARVKKSVACAMFTPPNHAAIPLVDWIPLLGQEAMVDAGLSTPADFIVNDQLSHRQNRRAVYEAAEHMSELARIRAGLARSSWRFASRFVIYFVKGIFAGFGMFLSDRFVVPKLLKYKD